MPEVEVETNWAVWAPRDWAHLWRWCASPVRALDIDPIKRWAIGVYQIGQALEWPDDGVALARVAWQSYAAACVHWLMCCASLDVSVLPFLPETLEEARFAVPGGESVWRRVMALVARGTQMVVYSQEPARAGPGRQIDAQGARFKHVVLAETTASLCQAMMSLVPPHQRVEAFYAEMVLLAGRGR